MQMPPMQAQMGQPQVYGAPQSGGAPPQTAPADMRPDDSQEFVFLSADHIRRFPGQTMPTRRELEMKYPDMLRRRRVSLKQVLLGELVETICTVSHRWFAKDRPDNDGVQLAEVKRYLTTEGRHIQEVWFDDWCMWQGERSESEKAEFKGMLANVNLLYLGTTVLILLDLSYMSRFWTQFEAWCSMQALTGRGVVRANGANERFVIKCIYNANQDPQNYTRALRNTWAGKTPSDAYRVLIQPDVTVTNEGDKDSQLPKLQKLDEMVQAGFQEMRSKAVQEHGGAVSTKQASYEQMSPEEKGALDERIAQLLLHKQVMEAIVSRGIAPRDARHEVAAANWKATEQATLAAVTRLGRFGGGDPKAYQELYDKGEVKICGFPANHLYVLPFGMHHCLCQEKFPECRYIQAHLEEGGNSIPDGCPAPCVVGCMLGCFLAAYVGLCCFQISPDGKDFGDGDACKPCWAWRREP